MDNELLLPDTFVHYREPQPLLRPFISHYVLRSIQVPRGHLMKKAMPLRTYSSLDFFLGDEFETRAYQTGAPLPFEQCMLRGPRTRKLCCIRISGHFISFSVRFRPTGLYRLTGLPMDRFTDKSVPAYKQLPGLPLRAIAGKLRANPDPDRCVRTVEVYLTRLAEHAQKKFHPIDQATTLLSQSDEPFGISQLAAGSFLCIRQLERVFLKEVGVSPKMFHRMHRFRRLLAYKLSQPDTRWTEAAYAFGYYDQRHLARDFRQFLDVSPSGFVAADFAF